MATGVGVAAVGSALPAFADHHSHPTPQSLSYLDRNTYVKNMEVIAHILPGEDRGGKMQFMSIGSRRYLLQQGDVIDISDLHKPQMFNKGRVRRLAVAGCLQPQVEEMDTDDGSAGAHHRFDSGSSHGQV